MPIEELLTINRPQANSVEDVANNILCSCHGISTPPSSSYRIIDVKIWGTDVTGTFADPNVPGSPYDLADIVQLDDGSIEWSSNRVPSFSAANPTQNNSRIAVVALWETDDQPPGAWSDPAEVVPTWFKGKTVQECGLRYNEAEKRYLKKGVVRETYVDCSPTCEENGFLRFDQLGLLNAANTVHGYRLTLNGNPLRTECLQVAADRVAYSYGAGAGNVARVHRPAGPTLVPPSDREKFFFEFNTLPVWSIVIYQKGTTRFHTLFSDDKSRPDIVHLDPNKDVYVQVNYNRRYLTSMGGGFGLFVKTLQ